MINYEISKSYTEWKAVFDEYKDARDIANIKDVFIDVEVANPQKAHLMFEVANMAAMQAFMQSPENSANFAKAGQIVESTVVVPLAD